MDANMSISGSCRSFSSAKIATELIENDMNATAATRQQVRMKVSPSPNRVQSAVFDTETQWTRQVVRSSGNVRSKIWCIVRLAHSGIETDLIAFGNRGQLGPSSVVDFDSIGDTRGARHSLGLAGDQDREILLGRLCGFHPGNHGVDLRHHAVARRKPAGVDDDAEHAVDDAAFGRRWRGDACR